MNDKSIKYDSLTSSASRAELLKFIQQYGGTWAQKLAVTLGLGGWLCRSQVNSVRMSRFAQDNDWESAHNVDVSSHQGLIFSQGFSRLARDVIYSEEGGVVYFEMGNYEYKEERSNSSKSKTYHWVYGCIRLDRSMPHMLLDARSNNRDILGYNSFSNLPIFLDKSQVLSLEGDFDKYFTLYAPKEYKRDALYVFTPDVMTLLIDMASKFDIEVIDDKLYVYSRIGVLSMPESEIIYKMLCVIQSIGVKLSQQSAYYADEFVGDRSSNVVGEGGRRLAPPVTRLATAIGVGVVLYIIGMIVIVNVFFV